MPLRHSIRLHEADNVVTALKILHQGDSLGEHNLFARQTVPRGHKVATSPIESGDAVRKYGQVIGYARSDIDPGEHVHTHNLDFRHAEVDYAFSADARPFEPLPLPERATFQGIVRADGRVATRNYIGVLTSVNCSASVAKMISERFRYAGLLDDFPNVDGVVALTHGTGCGMAPEGEGMDRLRRVIAGFADHANFYGVLLVGLGCEMNQIGALMEAEALQDSDRLIRFTMQETGGTRASVERGIGQIKEWLPDANRVTRAPVPVSEIKLALQCGGSDAFSGISANPALGYAADKLVRMGGTSVLAETSEIYGAEHLLTRRAATPEIGAKLIELIKWWENYTEKHGGTMDNNPSPGNKEGGLTTILEKSLGAAAKGGLSNLADVLHYAEPIQNPGFNFMDSPGYDPVSVTGQVASGCNVVVFTTGRGSCFGCKPAPSIKLATNSEMYQRMSDDMDLNCGVIVDGEADVTTVGEEVFDLVVRTASGAHSKSEELGYGEDEFTPWVVGAVM